MNLEPTDYESAALTVELWALPRLKIPHTRRSSCSPHGHKGGVVRISGKSGVCVKSKLSTIELACASRVVSGFRLKRFSTVARKDETRRACG